MSYRSPVNYEKDHAMFQRTAKQAKRVNIQPTSMRGGFRF